MPQVTRVLGQPGALRSVAVSADGRSLVAGGADSTVRRWDLAAPARPALRADPSAPEGSTYAPAFDPAGQALATGHTASAAQLWDTDPQRVGRLVCAYAGDPVTTAEWNEYAGDGRAARPVCDRAGQRRGGRSPPGALSPAARSAR